MAVLNNPLLARLAKQRSLMTDSQRRQFLKSLRSVGDTSLKDLLEQRELVSQLSLKEAQESAEENDDLQDELESLQSASFLPTQQSGSVYNYDFLIRKRLHSRAFGRTKVEFLLDYHQEKRRPEDWKVLKDAETEVNQNTDEELDELEQLVDLNLHQGSRVKLNEEK